MLYLLSAYIQIDFIAASFTRKASDVYEIKEYVAELMDRYHPKGYPHPQVISKIENTEVCEFNA
jgi:pyruvate kinase